MIKHQQHRYGALSDGDKSVLLYTRRMHRSSPEFCAAGGSSGLATGKRKMGNACHTYGLAVRSQQLGPIKSRCRWDIAIGHDPADGLDASAAVRGDTATPLEPRN